METRLLNTSSRGWRTSLLTPGPKGGGQAPEYQDLRVEMRVPVHKVPRVEDWLLSTRVLEEVPKRQDSRVQERF
jgi:hypothetical protein